MWGTEDFNSVHEIARWIGFAFALFLCPCCAAYVLLSGKKRGATGRFQRRTFRCVAATIRHPNLALRVSVAVIAIGFANVALERFEDKEPAPIMRLLISSGMTGSVFSTFGIAIWRMLFSRSEPSVA